MEGVVKTERFERIQSLATYLERADHVDVKSIEGRQALPAFIAALFTYRPAWMEVLWRLRTWLVRFIGIRSETVADDQKLTGDNLPIEQGQQALFLTVCESDGVTYWVADCCESHLDFAVGVVAEPIPGSQGSSRFHVLTAVHYNSAAGKLYFNIIRPFHHLVVAAGMKNAVRL